MNHNVTQHPRGLNTAEKVRVRVFFCDLALKQQVYDSTERPRPRSPLPVVPGYTGVGGEKASTLKSTVFEGNLVKTGRAVETFTNINGMI